VENDLDGNKCDTLSKVLLGTYDVKELKEKV